MASRVLVISLFALFSVLYLPFALYGLEFIRVFWGGSRSSAATFLHIGGNTTAVPSSLGAAAAAEADAVVARAAAEPVLIGIVGGSGQWPFLQAIKEGRLTPEHPLWEEESCSYQGVPINCSFTIDPAQFSVADGLYFHVPGKPDPRSILPRQHPKQIRFAVSLESSVYYPHLDDPAYMCNFEAEATYRSCSQVQQSMHHETNHDFDSGANLVHLPELPWGQKEHAVAYINSNCLTASNRAAVMKAWMELDGRQVPIHSFGSCDNNMPWPHDEGGRELTKREIFSRYRFCIAIENSRAYDYITEKVWDALSAGCVPIYLGSETIFSLVPDPHGIIVLGKNVTGMPELDELVHKLGSDKAQYEQLLAWKHKPVEELSTGYQQYLQLVGMTNECRLCGHIVKKRLENSFGRDTTCLFNETWLHAAGKPLPNVTCPEDEQLLARQEAAT